MIYVIELFSRYYIVQCDCLTNLLGQFFYCVSYTVFQYKPDILIGLISIDN